MEVEEMHIVRSQAKVVGLDGASLQGPSVPSQIVFKLDQPERRPQLKALFEVAAGQSGFQKLVISCRSRGLRSV